MSSRHQRPPVAMVEDVDDDDRVIEGSGHYARSNAFQSPPGSPLRQQMNTSKKKSSRSRRDSLMSPPGYDLDSDLPSPPSKPSRRDSKTEKKRSSMGSKGKTVVLKEEPRPKRPSTRTAKTAPGPPPRGLADESQYYGIPSQTIIPSNSRPRASTRPASYYGSSRPPLSHSAYYGGSAPLGTSFPPPQWNGGPPGMPPPMGPPQMMTHSPLSGPPVDYFSNNARPADTLAARFSRQGEPRPRSSLGFHGGPPSAYDDYEPSQIIETPPPMRHASLARRPKKDQDDRSRMPPPARPQTTKPERVVFRPPPPSSHRKSAHFADDDELDDEAETEDGFYEPAPGREPSFEYGATAVVPSRPRRTSIDSEDYEDSVFPLEEPAGHNRRHSSYGFEDKVKQAASYQNEVSGGTAPLTADALRRVKNGGNVGTSRSSRSTQSRDESSYKQSATTRTTRSSSGDDDITIKVPDGAIVEVGNAKISCRMGGEINIGRNNSGSDRGTVYEDDRKSRAIEDRKTRAIEDRQSRAIEDRKTRAIEDRKSRTYEDDRKSRTDKPATRNRASSQSGSYSHAPYLGGHGGYAPAFGSHYGSPAHYAPPQYPQYPSSEYESYYET